MEVWKEEGANGGLSLDRGLRGTGTHAFTFQHHLMPKRRMKLFSALDSTDALAGHAQSKAHNVL